MEVIVDADVIIRGEKGLFDFNGWMASRANDDFAVAAITIAELWHGIERATGNRRIEREQYVQNVLTSFPVIPYTRQTALIHAQLWAELMAAGRLIGLYDLIVAATALERGSDVATFNTRHFRQVRGLNVIEPR